MTMMHYSYDVTGRLTEVSLEDGRRIRYSYDASGNRLSMVVSGCGRQQEMTPPLAEEVAPPLAGQTPEPAAGGKLFCTACGSQLRAGVRFCTQCGAPLTPRPA